MNKITFNFQLKANKAKPDAPAYIVFSASVNRCRIRRNIGYSIPPGKWSATNQCAKVGHRDTAAINAKINIIKSLVYKAVNAADADNVTLTVNDVLELIDAPVLNNASFADYILREAAKEFKNKNITLTTRRTFVSLARNLKRFNPAGVAFAEISPRWWSQYQAFCLQCGNGSNTIAKKLAHCRIFLNMAAKDGMIKGNPLNDIKVKKHKTSREFLTFDEIRNLHHYFTNCKKPRERNALRSFLFACYTGLRFSDVKDLTWDNMQNGWICFTQKKTRTEIKLPLNQPALEVIGAGSGRKDRLFTLYNETNDILKPIFRKLKITRRITFHCARHSFATNSLILSKDIATVSKLLGHADIKTTSIYAQIVDQAKTDVVNLWNKKPGE